VPSLRAAQASAITQGVEEPEQEDMVEDAAVCDGGVAGGIGDPDGVHHVWATASQSAMSYDYPYHQKKTG
jgi:hypothetical protein